MRARDIEREEEYELLRARILELESPPPDDEPILVDLTESAEESEEELPSMAIAAAPTIEAPVGGKVVSQTTVHVLQSYNSKLFAEIRLRLLPKAMADIERAKHAFTYTSSTSTKIAGK